MVTRKIYFAMSDWDIGCFEWDSIYMDKEKCLDRLMEMDIQKFRTEYLKTDKEKREWLEKHYCNEEDVIE